MSRVIDKVEASVALHRLRNGDEKRLRDRVAGIAHQDVHNLFCVMSGGPSVPQCERGDAIGMNMLGGSLELSEGSNGLAHLVS